MADLIIKGGTIVNPEGSFKADVVVANERIEALVTNADGIPAEKIIDATGMYVLPGMIDSHAHIAANGAEFDSLDNYYNGTIAAAYGGTTSFIDFPFLKQNETPISALERKLKEVKGASVLDYSFHPCANKADEKFFGEIRELMQSGYTSVKLFTVYRNTLMMPKEGILEVLKIVGEENGIALVHAESADLVEAEIAKRIREGKTTPWDHTRTRTVESELDAMFSTVSLAMSANAPIIFAHMTTGRSRDLLDWCIDRHPVYAEVCPHYLALDEEKFKGEDACNFVCSPPMRSKQEAEELWSVVEDGYVDMINSDHTDYSSAQKKKHKDYFPDIPNGLPTIETRGPVFFSEGVAKGRISINRFVELTSTNAAKLYGMYPRKGIIRVGSDADITVINPDTKRIWTAADHHMQTDYSPFEGLEVTGAVVHTIVRGNPVIENGVFTNTSFRGKLMERGKPQLY